MKRITPTLSAALGLVTAMSFVSLNSPADLIVEGKVQTTLSTDIANDADVNAQAELRAAMEYDLNDTYKLIVEARILKELTDSGVSNVNRTKLHEVIRRAIVTFSMDDVLGLPRANIRFGKDDMEFGQEIANYLGFEDRIIQNSGTMKEVYGLSVVVPTTFLTFADEISASIFETGKRDLDFESQIGASVRLKKAFMGFDTQVSAMVAQHKGQDLEARLSAGAIYRTASGYEFHGQAVLMRNNPDAPGANFALELGVTKQMGPGDVVIEIALVENYAKELIVAYNIPMNSYVQNLVLSPEVRYTKYEDGSETARIGATAAYGFGVGSSQKARAGNRR